MWQLEKYKRLVWKWESKMNREELEGKGERAKERKTIERRSDGGDRVMTKGTTVERRAD